MLGYLIRASVVALLAVLVSAPTARAHGRPPRPVRVVLDPSDPSRIFVVATFGVIASTDGGESWRWVCAAAFGADPVLEDPDLVLGDDGAMVLATFDGIQRSSPDFCGFTPAEGEVQDVYVVDLAADPVVPARLWGLVSSGVRADRLVRSDDGGRRWVPVGAPIEGVLTERLALAPSEPSRVYVSAAHPDPRAPRAFLLRSDDGGERFEAVEIPVVSGERQPHVLGVDPQNPDRLFVRMARGEVDPRPERLLLSEDGGRTFVNVMELPNMKGFALSEDGRTVWVSSALNRGLWMAPEGTMAFEQVNTVDALCLAARGEQLWVCADQRLHGFALGRSLDEGARITPVLRFEAAGELVECPRCSRLGLVCPAWIPDLRADLDTYFRDADAGMTGLPRDAGTPLECRPEGGVQPPAPPLPAPAGCGCRVSPPRVGGRLGRSMLVVLLALRFRAVRARRVRER